VPTDERTLESIQDDELRRQYNKIMPWHSMAIISNEIMRLINVPDGMPHARAEDMANVYIA
jgi:hypothetical protein